MHFDLTDQYKHRSSAIHYRDPRVKVAIIVLFILSCSLMPNGAWLGFASLLVMILVLTLLSQLGLTFTLRRSFVVLPFVLVAFPLLFTIPGDIIYTLPVLDWGISAQGLERFLTVMLRSWIAIQAAILLTAITPFPDLLWALGALRLPRSLVATIGFMSRYIFVMGDEALRMIRARSSRSARLAGTKRPSILWQGRVAGNMVGSLFIRALERSERVHAAMIARGYNGEMLTFNKHVMSLSDWAVLGIMVTILSGLLIWITLR
jgi:cobalt/nickel transport system permease protein